MAQILRLRRKQNTQPDPLVPVEDFKAIVMEATEASTNRMWSFSLVFIGRNQEDATYQSEFYSINTFLETYEILGHYEIPEKELSHEEIMAELSKP
jgi:hypothetical protein